MTGKRLIIVVLILVFCLIGYIAAMHLIKQSAIDEIHQTAADIPLVEELDFTCLNIGILNPKLTIKDISVKLRGLDDKITIEKIQLHDFKAEKSLIRSLSLKATGIRLPVDSLPIFAKAKYTGKTVISDPLFNLNCHYTYDPASKAFHLVNFYTESKEIGELYLRLRLLNMDLNCISLENSAMLLSSLMGVSLDSATVIYDDHSFLHNIIKQPENSENAAIKKMIDNFKSHITGIANKVKDPFVLKVLLKLRNFLTAPDRIEVHVIPEEPVLLGRLLFIRRPEEFIRLLNIRVETP